MMTPTSVLTLNSLTDYEVSMSQLKIVISLGYYFFYLIEKHRNCKY